ncbi:phosphatase PAP2 family protein [Lampropedia aestuarii]|uniref:phosphatase PAP2 family protein n=1 Tax=Lampropedia aestuarii TaxID=2562762 RepID=UPI0024688B83|nr:phosphatase PAP2 family protein [Lampropedia aestuarii]MDH5858384.1 phosphatase PAP2 family protein [Lampropedia aestuarii]
MNHSIFLWINSWRSPAIDAVLNAVSLSGSALNIVWLLPLACALLLLRCPRAQFHARLRFLAVAALGFALAMALVAAFKFGLQLPRPGTVFGSQVVHSIVPEDSRYSFPSGHATFAMWLAVCLWPRVSALARCALVVYVIAVGLARINLGMHFPADVLVGYAIGACCAWLSRWLLLRTGSAHALPQNRRN